MAALRVAVEAAVQEEPQRALVHRAPSVWRVIGRVHGVRSASSGSDWPMSSQPSPFECGRCVYNTHTLTALAIHPLPFTHSLDTLPPQALERCLGEYTQILTERSQLIDDVDSLREQNQELKSVLNHYLSAPVRGPPHRHYNAQPLLKLTQTNPFFGVHVFLVYTGQPRAACATNTSHPHRCRRTIELQKFQKFVKFSISD